MLCLKLINSVESMFLVSVSEFEPFRLKWNIGRTLSRNYRYVQPQIAGQTINQSNQSINLFLRCAIIGNVQVNWPKLFQDFSVKFTVIFSYMRSFNPKPLQLES